MWKSLYASEAGTSHRASGLPCQDAAGVRRLVVQGAEYLLIAICDGAGSAELAHEGARFVVDHWLDTAAVELHLESAISEDAISALAETCHEALLKLARERNKKARDFACTLLTAVLGPDESIFFQLGDGVWVQQNGDELSAVTWPHQGEFAGETVFLTSADRQRHYQIQKRPTGEAVAGLTDGLERLAVNFANRTPLPGFFRPMWSALKQSNDPALASQLARFLDSEPVNNRTDDDKTLVLVVRSSHEG